MRITPRPEVDRRWADWQKNRVRKALRRSQPAVSMAEEAAALMDRREIVFRGRKYHLPPVPWPLAVRVNAQMDRLRALAQRHSPDEEAEVFAAAARLLHEAYTPASPVRRVLHRWLPNPFLQATPSEVGRYLGFCYMSQRLDDLSTTSTLPHGTSSLHSDASPSASPPGLAGTDSPFPGDTSSWE